MSNIDEVETPHAFVSYVHENRDIVDKLCSNLGAYGVPVWRDRQDIDPGLRWQDAIRSAIRHGAFFVACFSREYNARTRSYMNEELSLAIEELRQRPRDRVWFIPVLFSGSIPDWGIGAGETLRNLQWVELTEANWDQGIQRIVAVIQPEVHNARQRCRRLSLQLSSPVSFERAFAVEQLSKYGVHAVQAVPRLAEILRDNSESMELRRSAAQTLKALGPAAKEAIPALLAILDDTSSVLLPIDAIEALGGMGPAARPASSKLVELAQNESENSYVRGSAGMALSKICPENPQAVSAVIGLLLIQTYPVYAWAADFLESMGSPTERDIPKLVEVFSQPQPWPHSNAVAIAAAIALGGINSRAQQAVAPVIEQHAREQEGHFSTYEEWDKAWAEALPRVTQLVACCDKNSQS